MYSEETNDNAGSDADNANPENTAATADKDTNKTKPPRPPRSNANKDDPPPGKGKDDPPPGKSWVKAKCIAPCICRRRLREIGETLDFPDEKSIHPCFKKIS